MVSERLVKAANLLFLSVLSVAIVYLIVFVYNSEDSPVEEKCNSLDLGSAFYYESCYDAYSKTIFFGVKRGYDDFSVNSIDLTFFDFSEKAFGLEKFPSVGGQEVYKIPAEKNPGTLNLTININSRSLENVCPIFEGVFVSYCSDRISGEDVELGYNPLSGVVTTDYIDLGFEDSSDVFSLSLVEKEQIWESRCSSNWDCSSWEACVNGVQKRTCEDKNDCFISTNYPEVTRLCDGNCIEDWECTWSKCLDGLTIPDCNDLSNCGTSYNRPSSLKCSENECAPDVYCGNWSVCSVNYSFFSINDIELENIGGVKSRICRDKNSCVETTEEISACSLGIDIYTKTFKQCGTEYLGLYNSLDDSLIARIDQGTKENPHVNVYFEDGDLSEYCDYCYDGVLNGDETKIDCGGSCISCYDKYGSY